MGKGNGLQLDLSRRHQRRSIAAVHQQGRQNLGTRFYAQGDLGNCVEEALHVSEHDLRLVIDSIPGFVWTDTAAGEIEFVNQPYLNYLGGTLEEVKDWQTALHADDRERVKAEWSRSLETGQPFETEVRIRRADGVYRWFNARCTPLREAEGRIVRWYNLLTDIDERR